jgi:hypothetical protein
MPGLLANEDEYPHIRLSLTAVIAAQRGSDRRIRVLSNNSAVNHHCCRPYLFGGAVLIKLLPAAHRLRSTRLGKRRCGRDREG